MLKWQVSANIWLYFTKHEQQTFLNFAISQAVDTLDHVLVLKLEGVKGNLKGYALDLKTSYNCDISTVPIKCSK